MLSKTALLICGTVAFVAVISAYVVLSWLHIDTAPFLLFVGGAGTALLPGLAAWRNTETIKDQTNGPLTKTNETVLTLHETVSHLVDRMEQQDSVLTNLSDRLEKVNV